MLIIWLSRETINTLSKNQPIKPSIIATYLANVAKWASESIKIPYRHPLTGKYTVYVPDFFIVYNDKEGRKHAEMIEVKPMSQTTLERAGKSMGKKKQVVINMAKWEAANAYAKQNRMRFRVVSEDQLFHNGKRK